MTFLNRLDGFIGWRETVVSGLSSVFDSMVFRITKHNLPCALLLPYSTVNRAQCITPVLLVALALI